MHYCRHDRPVDRLHEQELDRLNDMSAQNDIGVVAAMYYCANEGICPPPWLTQSASKLLIELSKRERSRKRGRAGGRIARYGQDLRDYERWSAVLDVRELRRRYKKELKDLSELSAQGKLTAEGKNSLRRVEKACKWLRQDIYDCASMCLRGSNAHARPGTVKKTYLRVNAAMRMGSAAHRYHLMFGDFVSQIGVDWPGARKGGTKFVPFYELTL